MRFFWLWGPGWSLCTVGPALAEGYPTTRGTEGASDLLKVLEKAADEMITEG